MTLPGIPLHRILVGDLRWVAEGIALFFPAFGDKPTDGRVVRFETIEVHRGGACFVEGGKIRAFLSPIEKAAVEDPEDYRVGWQLWQEVLPLRRGMVERACTLAMTERSNGTGDRLAETRPPAECASL